VVVENRVGGNGNLAGELVAKVACRRLHLAPRYDSLMVINPHLYAKMSFRSAEGSGAVASLVSNGFFLAINPSVSAQTFPNSSNTRAAPTRRCSTPRGQRQPASPHHGALEGARRDRHDPHPVQGGAPATTATVAGEVAVMSRVRPPRRRSRRAACARSLLPAATLAVLPEVPTIAEFYPDFVMVQWYGLFAPAALRRPRSAACARK